MFLLRRPSQSVIERFLRDSQEAALSYGPVGIARTSPPGFDCDETITVLGRGAADFDRARAAVRAWTPFAFEWVDVFPAAAPVAIGIDVAVLVRHAGFWSLNGCRIVDVMNEPDRAGFAYGTLGDHAEQGEELFEVAIDSVSDEVTYRIRAVSRPRLLLARIGYPIARALQARFRRDSAAAMRRAVAGYSSSSRSARRSISS